MRATEVERKINQLDNDGSEIYTMIADVQNTQRRHTHRFNEIGSRLDTLIDRGASTQSRGDRLDRKVDGLDQKVDSLGQQVARLTGRVDGVDDTLGSISASLTGIATTLEQVTAAVLPPDGRGA